MNRTVYLNGSFLPVDQARVSIFDRAVLFGDAVYEGTGVLGGKLVDYEHHVNRLERSLAQLSIPMPLTREQLLAAHRRLVADNDLDEGLVYLQISRGEAERDFVYSGNLEPTVLMFTQVKSSVENELAQTGAELKSGPDIRWARRDIKSINLLGQVLAKQAAHEAGAYEALMVDPSGYVTECGSTSFFAVIGDLIITRPLSNDILPGVTRHALIELCRSKSLKLEERLMALEEVYNADEAFITGASTYVLPVTRIDGRNIGNGFPGKISERMRQLYIDHAKATAI